MEVACLQCPVPSAPGLYGWYFREVPAGVPVSGCIRHNDLTLLYIGIAPTAPARIGRTSQRTLRNRIRDHYYGNASGSTLRLTLGCLLRQRLGIELRRTASGKRMTFGDGERALSEWMGQNAFVAWVAHPSPWEAESMLISELNPPLNLAHNRSHPFYPQLSALRREAKKRARSPDSLAGGS